MPVLRNPPTTRLDQIRGHEIHALSQKSECLRRARESHADFRKRIKTSTYGAPTTTLNFLHAADNATPPTPYLDHATASRSNARECCSAAARRQQSRAVRNSPIETTWVKRIAVSPKSKVLNDMQARQKVVEPGTPREQLSDALRTHEIGHTSRHARNLDTHRAHI